MFNSSGFFAKSAPSEIVVLLFLMLTLLVCNVAAGVFAAVNVTPIISQRRRIIVNVGVITGGVSTVGIVAGGVIAHVMSSDSIFVVVKVFAVDDMFAVGIVAGSVIARGMSAEQWHLCCRQRLRS